MSNVIISRLDKKTILVHLLIMKKPLTGLTWVCYYTIFSLCQIDGKCHHATNKSGDVKFIMDILLAGSKRILE